MKNTGTRLACVFLVLAVFALGSQISAEVGVVVEFANQRVSGPFSIIDDADPINNMVWDRQSVVSTTRILLNENGAINGDGLPSTTYNTISRLAIVAWGKKNGALFDVVVSHFENGAWTTPHVIASGVTSTRDPEPQLVIDQQNGDVHLVYFGDDIAPNVFHAQAPADLTTWTTPVQVSQTGDIAMRPSVALHQGVVRVVYESHALVVDSTPRQFVVASADGAGGFVYEVIADSQYAGANRPRIHAGSGAALWLDWIDSSNAIGWSVWQPGTGWGTVQLEPYTDIADREFQARGRVRLLASP